MKRLRLSLACTAILMILWANTALADGYCSISEGVDVSPSPVILGQDFTVSFTLKEVMEESKTFERVAVAILREDGSFVFDFAMYENVHISANDDWSPSPTNYLYNSQPPGTYKAEIRGKVAGGDWFVFDTVDGGVNTVAFTAVKPEGYCSVSSGVGVSPSPVVLDRDFTVSFTLKEVRGADKTFERVAVAILHSDGPYVFDLAMYENVTVSANGAWTQSPSGVLWLSNGEGTYKAEIRGKVAGGDWFVFDTVDGGINPREFSAVKPEGYCSVSAGVDVSPSPVVLDRDFTVGLTLKEVRGAEKTFERVAVAILRSDNSFVFDLAMYENVTVPASGTWSQAPTGVLYSSNGPGTYKAIIRGKVPGGDWFDFDTAGGGVNPRSFTAVNPEGHCSVSALNLSVDPVVLGQSFDITFSLTEVRGASKTFEKVAVAILRVDGSTLFDFAMYENVTVPGNGTWSEKATNSIYTSNPPGTYKAMVRGKLPGGDWFDFDATGSGINPKGFRAVRKDQTVDPKVAQQPMSGTPGTTFVQWGTGFTPNNTAVLHFKKPNGTEYPTLDIATDGIGHFEISYTAPWDKPPGTYTWWGVDEATGLASNTVSYEITSGSGAALSGKVYSDSNGSPIEGAEVTVANLSAMTDQAGWYSIPSTPSGNFRIKASKAGWAPVIENIYIPPDSRTLKDFYLSPAGSGLNVTSVSSKYSGKVFYLDGFDLNVKHTANTNWAGHSPGKVRFTTPRSVYDVSTGGTVASQTLNMGHDLGLCGTLKVKAISTDGMESPELEADVAVFPHPFPSFDSLFLFVDEGSSFSFNGPKAGVNFSFIEEGVDAGLIPDSIPLFGGVPLRLDFIPEISASFGSSGKANVHFEWGDCEVAEVLKHEYGRKDNLKKIIALIDDYLQRGKVDKRRLPKAAMAGFEVHLYPYVEATGTFSDVSCFWDWGGTFGIAGSVEAKKSWPYIFMAGPVPVPMYVKASISLEVDGSARLVRLDPAELSGGFGMNPEVRGSLGAGVDSVIAVEGWLGGGAEMDFQWPQTPTLSELGIYLNGGVSLYAYLWEWEQEMLRWEWDLRGNGHGTLLRLPEEAPVGPRLVDRDYLSLGTRGRFLAGGAVRDKTVIEDGLSREVSLASLQSDVFPHSEPSISTGASKLYLCWLQDNPERSSINRTMAVASVFDGKKWSDPVPIKDDGTADFHPDILAFSNGSAWAAWENEGTVLGDEAKFEDMLRKLDISVSRFNRGTGRWRVAKRITRNPYLDRSPKIAGDRWNKALLTWIANKANDIRGNIEKPNLLRFSIYDGKTWTEAGTARKIPHGVLKYDTIFDGATGWVVLSLDTDNDPATIEDRELFRVGYASGTWGPLERLTNNKLPDESPKLAKTPDGEILLTWLRDGKIQSVKGFDFSDPVVAVNDKYSSNLSDFRLCSAPSGMTAVVWAEPSGYASDIFAAFYDPSFAVWGSPRKLTNDPETERYLAAAFDERDKLTVVYDRTSVSVTKASRATLAGKEIQVAIPKPVSTDLYMLRYKTGGDLALEPETFTTVPVNPHPGEDVTLKVKAVNNGELAASDFPVAFYSGNPERGGKEIGRRKVREPLLPGDCTLVELAWSLPDPPPSSVFAVVDPEYAVEDRKRNNNKVRRSLSQPDLTIKTMTWRKETDALYTVTARVVNLGAVPAPDTNIRFRKRGLKGALISSQTLPSLRPLESFDASIRIDPSDFSGGDMVIYAVVDQGGKIAEFDERNNVDKVIIE